MGFRAYLIGQSTAVGLRGLVWIPAIALFAIGLSLMFALGAQVVGGVVVGAALSLGATLFPEDVKRGRARRDLATALYAELALRVARCCFDFEKPWSGSFQ